MINKKLKNFTLSIITFALLFSSFAGLVNSVSLSDPDDSFVVISPRPNAKIKNNAEISFRVFDDDQSQIQYTANIYDPQSCNSTNYGNINPGNTVTSSQSQNVSFSWNTRGTQSTSNLADGRYCLQICVFLLNRQTPYSACNSRFVDIVNNNSQPVITSQPGRTSFTEGETFNYQVQATDPDGDQLTYRFVRTSGFLSINPNTGQITSQPLSTLGNVAIYYPITIAVDDGVSGEVRQSFTLSIFAPEPEPQQPTPSTPTVPPVEPDPDDQPSDPGVPTDPDDQEPPEEEPDTGGEQEPPEINEEDVLLDLLAPIRDEVITDDQMVIQWQINQGTDLIDSLELEYSIDANTWEVINPNLGANRTYFIWQLGDIEDGEYFVRLTANLVNDQSLNFISDKFFINREEGGDTDIESIPLVINEMPESNSEVEYREDLQITAELLASEGEQIVTNNVNVIVDGEDYNQFCQANNERVVCTPPEPLQNGRHVVSITIEDTAGKVNDREWFFTVVGGPGDNLDTDQPSEDDSQGNETGTVTVFGREISTPGFVLIVIILCVGLALLIIPWLLYIFWIRKPKKNKRQKNQSQTTQPQANSPLQPITDQNNTFDSNSYLGSFDVTSGNSEASSPQTDAIEPYSPQIDSNTQKTSTPVLNTDLSQSTPPQQSEEQLPSIDPYSQTYDQLERYNPDQSNNLAQNVQGTNQAENANQNNPNQDNSQNTDEFVEPKQTS